MARVLIFGAGSIGSVYAWVLTRAGAHVTCVCRSNYSQVAEHGFTINSDVFGSDLHVAPAVVDKVEPPPADAPWDFIIVTSKAFPGADPGAPAQVAPAVASQKTAIVLAQNGIGIEDEWKRAFPDNPILSGVVYLPVTQTAPGRVQMGGVERLEVGAFPAAPVAESTALGDFMELVQRGGATILVYDDIQPRRWAKMLVNASWNPICALARQSDVGFMASSPQATDFVWSVMLEVVKIAQACGYAEITEDEAKHQLGRAKARIGTDGIEPSMLADAKADRPLEVEAIVGNAVRIAKEKDVSVPNLTALYALAKALDEGMKKRRAGA